MVAGPRRLILNAEKSCVYSVRFWSTSVFSSRGPSPPSHVVEKLWRTSLVGHIRLREEREEVLAHVQDFLLRIVNLHDERLGSEVFVCVSLPSEYVSTAVSETVTGEGAGETVAGRCHGVVAVVPPNDPGPVHR